VHAQLLNTQNLGCVNVRVRVHAGVGECGGVELNHIHAQTLKECKLQDGGMMALIYKKTADVSDVCFCVCMLESESDCQCPTV